MATNDGARDGSKGLERALAAFYTEEEIRARLPGSRQNQSQRMKYIRDIAGIAVRGITVYRKRDVDKYFDNPPATGRPRGRKNTPGVPVEPAVAKKKAAPKKKVAAKKKRAVQK